MTKPFPYVGRFAPSPTGKLHLGSLISAVASYLDAKAHQGQWLVRIEDLDPPREEVGAANSILRSLEAHHLFWDGEILYQSQRLDAYQAELDQLSTHTYPCDCIRQRIASLNGRYDGHCQQHPPKPGAAIATRIKIDALSLQQILDAEQFDDCFIGPQVTPLSLTGDFILRRKDGLFAYQLAVAVDDHFQGITHVIRGRDLLESTSRQRYLLKMMGAALPLYGHTPLALGTDGHKLSKQTKAPAINDEDAFNNLIAALAFLGHRPPKECIDSYCFEDVLNWAAKNWKREQVPTDSYIPQ